MKQQGQRKREHGFTLIELLVAIAILAFGLLAVSTMQISGLGGSFKANSATEVSTIAMDCMERLVGMTYAQVLVSGTYTDNTTYPGYMVTSNVAAGPITGTSEITLTVNGRGRSITLNWMKSQIVQVN